MSSSASEADFLTTDQIERLTIAYLDPPTEAIGRWVRDHAMDLWMLGLLYREESSPFGLKLTRLGLAAVGAI